MKRPRKFFKEKELLRKVREANANHGHFKRFWKHKGYKMWPILSKKAKKHPLYKDLLELLPIIAPPECDDNLVNLTMERYIFRGIKKNLYLKLKTTHKACFYKYYEDLQSDDLLIRPLAYRPNNNYIDYTQNPFFVYI